MATAGDGEGGLFRPTSCGVRRPPSTPTRVRRLLSLAAVLDGMSRRAVGKAARAPWIRSVRR